MLFEQFVQQRNISNRTSKSYKLAITKYEDYNEMTIDELIREAEEEEENSIRWKKRTLRKRLIGFRNEMYNTTLSSSAKTYMQRVTTFYRHFEVELQPLPPISKHVHTPEPIIYEDIPTRELLQKVINESKNKTFTTIIYFMTSSGLSMVDTLDLTMKDFLDACNVKTIQELDDIDDDFVPTFHLKRRKTNKYFYTFITPEATQEVVNYLKSREELTLDSKLFKISRDYLYKSFHKTNKKLGLGTKNKASLFRSHMLRKFHATTLLNSGLSMEQVDSLQGRSKNKVHQSYFLDDPNHMKKKYMEHMTDLIIFGDSDRILELEKSNKEYEVRISEQERLLQEIVEAQEKLEKLLEL
jgi:integrase